jgi:hypothetical protein
MFKLEVFLVMRGPHTGLANGDNSFDLLGRMPLGLTGCTDRLDQLGLPHLLLYRPF